MELHFSWQNRLASLNNQLTTNLGATALGSLPARFSVQSNAFHAPLPGGRAAPHRIWAAWCLRLNSFAPLKPSAALHQQSGIITRWRRSRQTDTLWLAESHLQGDGRWKWYSLSRWDNGTGVEELAGAAEERKMKIEKKKIIEAHRHWRGKWKRQTRGVSRRSWSELQREELHAGEQVAYSPLESRTLWLQTLSLCGCPALWFRKGPGQEQLQGSPTLWKHTGSSAAVSTGSDVWRERHLAPSLRWTNRKGESDLGRDVTYLFLCLPAQMAHIYSKMCACITLWF